MSILTNNEYKIQDHYQTRYEACRDTALSEFFDSIELIKQSFEHNLNDTPIADVPFHVIKTMVKAVEDMEKKSDFHYVDEFDDIHYEFYTELSAMLLDEYGWEI
jgi:hypothetical protein